MTIRIEVGPRPGIDDPAGNRAAEGAREFLGLDVEGVRTRSVYKLSFELDPQEVERVLGAIADPVLEESALDRLDLPECHWIIAIGYKPGVTDNLGRTARVFVSDVLGRDLAEDARVFTETLYLVRAPVLAREQVHRLAREILANELIHSIQVWTADAYRSSPIDRLLPLARGSGNPRAVAVALPGSDEDLLELSRDRTLSLSLTELQAIRDHYDSDGVRRDRAALGLPGSPTDVELEALAQTWSEHCKHKIFNATINYLDRETGEQQTIHSLFRTFITEPTRRIGHSRVDWLVSVFDDNAGVIRLAEDINLVYKVETHNSPSALDPYGGAITGIVGVNRDPMGTGIGATLLTNVWGYCLASPFYEGPVPEGLLHPRRIRDGVHQGVIDGGNQSGIPYSRGFELFDKRYLGKPLVFCGTVGLMPVRIADRPSHRKQIRPGDHVVMLGGRIGTDGIHGATFSSEALHGQSPAQAVQIGDPITQKKMHDMLLEARDLCLYRAITDNGAGGLSSSVGEMARLCNGAELDLDLAPLKYPGLQPWEILLSEAQERMTLAVPPEHLDALLDLARRREVEATPIGRFTASGTFLLRHGGEVVGALDMGFLHGGCPIMELDATWDPPRHLDPSEAGIDLSDLDPSVLLGDLLAGLDLCSKERKWREYDHEVKGLSVIKPLCGARGDVPSDATVMRVTHGRDEAILLAEGIAPRLSDLDAGAMAASVVDLATRRIIAAGGKLGQIAGLDNFCWPDPVQSDATPDGRLKLASLVRACRALAQMTEGLDLPCISGKDSMKNDSVRGGVKISIPPTLLFSALGWIDDARRALDLTASAPGQVLYLIGQTRAELGGSELLHHLSQVHEQPDLKGNRAPRISAGECRAVCSALQAAVDQALVSAAHAPHVGGLGVGLASLCMAADLGLEVCLERVPLGAEMCPVEILFSESGSRLLAVVPVDRVDRFEESLATRPVPWARLGRFIEHPELRVTRGDQEIIRVSVEGLRNRFKETLDV